SWLTHAPVTGYQRAFARNVRSGCSGQRYLSSRTSWCGFPDGVVRPLQPAPTDRECELACEQKYLIDGNVFVEPCHEQYGRYRHISSESIQPGRRIRAGVNGCPSSHDAGRVHHDKMECHIQSTY